MPLPPWFLTGGMPSWFQNPTGARPTENPPPGVAPPAVLPAPTTPQPTAPPPTPAATPPQPTAPPAVMPAINTATTAAGIGAGAAGFAGFPAVAGGLSVLGGAGQIAGAVGNTDQPTAPRVIGGLSGGLGVAGGAASMFPGTLGGINPALGATTPSALGTVGPTALGVAGGALGIASGAVSLAQGGNEGAAGANIIGGIGSLLGVPGVGLMMAGSQIIHGISNSGRAAQASRNTHRSEEARSTFARAAYAVGSATTDQELQTALAMDLDGRGTRVGDVLLNMAITNLEGRGGLYEWDPDARYSGLAGYLTRQGYRPGVDYNAGGAVGTTRELIDYAGVAGSGVSRSPDARSGASTWRGLLDPLADYFEQRFPGSAGPMPVSRGSFLDTTFWGEPQFRPAAETRRDYDIDAASRSLGAEYHYRGEPAQAGWYDQRRAEFFDMVRPGWRTGDFSEFYDTYGRLGRYANTTTPGPEQPADMTGAG